MAAATREIRHNPKYDKFGAGSILKHIGDQLASLLYGDGKTLGFTRGSGILGRAQMLLVQQHKLLDSPIRVYVPARCVDAKYLEKGHFGSKFTDGNHYDSIKRMTVHAQQHGVDIKIVIVEN